MIEVLTQYRPHVILIDELYIQNIIVNLKISYCGIQSNYSNLIK